MVSIYYLIPFEIKLFIIKYRKIFKIEKVDPMEEEKMDQELDELYKSALTYLLPI